MTAIVTSNFHTHSARQFVESLSEASNDVYYVFLGRPTAWSNGDSVVTSPDDSPANTAFSFWDDIVCLRRITSSDLTYVVPREDWTANSKYSMYDHRIPTSDLVSNDAPVYVVTSENQVFKCIHNGKTNATSEAANSTSEPTVSGQSDITALTYASGSPNDYIWKYLYTVSSDDQAKYLTTAYLPVRATFDSLDDNGDVYDDGSDQYDVFHKARITGNGAIVKVVVENQGSGYTNPPSITIVGDGSGADAVANVASGQLLDVVIANAGNNYSYATAVITANGDSGTGATAVPIISPRTWFANSSGTYYKTNHGINLVDELGARRVMLYVQFNGIGQSGLFPVGNNFRRIGIIKNPQLYGTTQIATGNDYSQMYELTLTNQVGSFTPDEIVWQQATNAYGVVVETSGSVLKLVNVRGTFSNTGTTAIIGVGNGNTAGQQASPSVTIPATPEPFTPVVASSNASADIASVATPDIQPYSGTILFVDHRSPVTRSVSQAEIIRTILTF